MFILVVKKRERSAKIVHLSRVYWVAFLPRIEQAPSSTGASLPACLPCCPWSARSGQVQASKPRPPQCRHATRIPSHALAMTSRLPLHPSGRRHDRLRVFWPEQLRDFARLGGAESAAESSSLGACSQSKVLLGWRHGAGEETHIVVVGAVPWRTSSSLQVLTEQLSELGPQPAERTDDTSSIPATPRIVGVLSLDAGGKGKQKDDGISDVLASVAGLCIRAAPLLQASPHSRYTVIS